MEIKMAVYVVVVNLVDLLDILLAILSRNHSTLEEDSVTDKHKQPVTITFQVLEALVDLEVLAVPEVPEELVVTE